MSTTLSRLYGSDRPADEQRRAFRDGAVPVAVYGLGKMGLPLAAVFADRSGNVTGVDIDSAVVNAINDGRSPVEDEPGLDTAVETAVETESLRATTDGVDAAESAALHVVIVPTLLDDTDTPDLSAVESVVDDVAAGLAPGDAVFLESTLPPRTCVDVLQPRLVEKSGLAPDEFALAFCPERTASGRALEDITGSYPKIVGGVDEESTRVAKLVYGELTSNEVIPVSDPTTAECVKLFEGLYRDVNIALANELGRLADELAIDVREAIEAANTQPYCEIHDPGAGVGGHCIPYYPHFVIDTVETPTPLLETARRVNERMEEFTVHKTVEQLVDAGTEIGDASVAVLGVTYRPGIDETRASPAWTITAALSAAGADVYTVDPVCSDLAAFPGRPATLSDLPAIDPDALVLVTAHDAFDDVPWDRLADPVVVDGRDALTDPATAGEVYTIGSGPATSD
ncbi:nucleotide sugar dehydrogenase [Halomicrobium sp. HM KBTZ05]|uniref:nucleotide sugar dehydrogenase n=1 Tax=Halomicrobium sp. HM KBTZ05 TaxID=3242663 RepID=UPI00355722E2